MGNNFSNLYLIGFTVKLPITNLLYLKGKIALFCEIS